MKIRVTTEGKSVMVDMEPKLADKVFKALVLQLLQAGGGDREQPSAPHPSKPVEIMQTVSNPDGTYTVHFYMSETVTGDVPTDASMRRRAKSYWERRCRL